MWGGHSCPPKLANKYAVHGSRFLTNIVIS
jgi:hypothetical protein